MDIATHEELVAEVQAARANRSLAVFCGAGISIPPPARLPDARTLSRTVLETFLGSDLAAEIGVPDLRPEVLFQKIRRHDADYLIRVLASLLDAPSFNANHLLLAELLGDGCAVITTNFDLLIERAAAHLGVDASALFKIHGSIDDPDSLMLTIDQVNDGLSRDRTEHLRHLTRDRTLLVLGYSGLDQLDLMPELARCAYRRVLWINHRNEPAPVVERPAVEEVARLPRLTFLSYDTGALTGALLRNAMPRPMVAYRIAADLLAHQNRNADLHAFIARHSLAGDLYFDIASLDLRAGSLDDATAARERAGLLRTIRALPEDERRRWLPQLVKYSPDDDLDQLRLELVPESRRAAGPEVFEALLELAFRFMLRKRFDDAGAMLDLVEPYAVDAHDLLLQARLHINRAGLLFQRVEILGEPPSLLDTAAEHASRGRFLAGQAIYGDRFFEEQAVHNLAIIRRVQGRYDEAAALYREVADYYRDHNAGLYLQTLANMTEVELVRGEFTKARDIADEGLRHGRALRKSTRRAQLLAAKGRALWALGRITRAAQYLDVAAREYERTGDADDAALTRQRRDGVLAGAIPF
ncbi:MAG TPA: SIR2 family protein [Thermoanaerobaculia bacterium]|nr:SIR2 family protein [Thermoanaerobaculia bacterium]